MMSFLIVIGTILLVLTCLFLMLLVLIQLPKKEAGAGLAFGGGATDALFGAGSGNVLTNLTKWTAGIYFGLCLVLSVANSHANKSGGSELKKELSKPVAAPVAPFGTPSGAPSAPTKPLGANTNIVIPTFTNQSAPAPAAATNAPATAPKPAPATNTATNAPVAPPK
jgi:preprotein translocase subunit SecG